MAITSTEGPSIPKILWGVSAAWVAAAGLFLGLMEVVPEFGAWALSPWISPLIAAGIGLVLVWVVTVPVLLVIRSARMQRAKLEEQNRQQHAELEAAARTEHDELEATKAKNLHLESVLQELRIAAFYDVLTGVPNSRYLQHLLDDEPRRPGDTRCLILLDLENFGEINKKHNHWKGDEYLSKFAGKLLETTRRNEYVIKRRPPQEADGLEIQAFRRNSGGDEFYILLKGPFVDGLGYLNRLHRSAEKFETMAVDVLHSPHHFGFRAGLTSVGYTDSYETAAKRVCVMLGKAQEKSNVLVYWAPEETQYLKDEREKSELQRAIDNFGDPDDAQREAGDNKQLSGG
jgi:GGDEF domain-containing protein